MSLFRWALCSTLMVSQVTAPLANDGKQAWQRCASTPCFGECQQRRAGSVLGLRSLQDRRCLRNWMPILIHINPFWQTAACSSSGHWRWKKNLQRLQHGPQRTGTWWTTHGVDVHSCQILWSCPGVFDAVAQQLPSYPPWNQQSGIAPEKKAVSPQKEAERIVFQASIFKGLSWLHRGGNSRKEPDTYYCHIAWNMAPFCK